MTEMTKWIIQETYTITEMALGKQILPKEKIVIRSLIILYTS